MARDLKIAGACCLGRLSLAAGLEVQALGCGHLVLLTGMKGLR